MQKKFIGKLSKKAITGGMVLSMALYGAFNFSEGITSAQQAPNNIRVVCTPQKKQVEKNEDVIFTARVRNATSSIVYSWRGVNVQSVNSPRITVKYPAAGIKRATSTIVTNGIRVEAPCQVEVVDSEEIDPGQFTEQLESLQELFQNNQNGGAPSGGNTPGGSSPGGNTPGTSQQGTNQNGGNTPGGSNPASNNLPDNASQRTGSESPQGQEIESTLQEDLKKCRESKPSDKVADSIEEEITDQTEELSQQMVPTNPIPIVDPIKNIDVNIESLTLKEMGLSSSNQPALDKIRACEIDALLKEKITSSKNFLEQGRDGSPYRVTNFNNLIKDVHDLSTNEYLKALRETPSCKPSENQNIAEVLAVMPRSIIGSQGKADSCKIGEDPDDLNDIDAYINYTDTINNPSAKLSSAYAAMLGHRSSLVDLAMYETEINEGYIGVKDEDGTITQTPKEYLSLILNDQNIVTNRMVQLDENGESDSALFDDFLSKGGLPSQTGNFTLPQPQT